MLKINQSAIENISMKDLKAIEDVLKLYNNNISVSEEERMFAVIADSDGKLTEKEYNERLNIARSFTMENEVPNPADWAQIRTLYREIGNQRIVDARERHESISKEYTGTASVVDERYGNVSPSQAVRNFEDANKKVEIMKKLGVALSLGIGILLFLAVICVARLVLGEIIQGMSIVLVQVAGGVLGLASLVLGGLIGKIITKSILKKLKAERDYFEIVATKNKEVITKLQMAIKSSEENIKRIEAQYGVEILAKTDYSELVPFVKKEIKKESIDLVQNEPEKSETKNEKTTEVEEPELEKEPEKQENVVDGSKSEQEKPASKKAVKKAKKTEEKQKSVDETPKQTKNKSKKEQKSTKSAENKA